jgi:cytochrome c biogenesis factor
VMWVWIGGIGAVLGGLIAIWPAGARRRVKSPATKPARATVPVSA